VVRGLRILLNAEDKSFIPTDQADAVRSNDRSLRSTRRGDSRRL